MDTHEKKNKIRIALTTDEQAHLKVCITDRETFELHGGPYHSEEITLAPTHFTTAALSTWLIGKCFLIAKDLCEIKSFYICVTYFYICKRKTLKSEKTSERSLLRSVEN